jgi:hypothetical protein
MWLELCINLTSRLLWMKHLTNGDQWIECHAVIGPDAFGRFYVPPPPTVVASDNGIYPRCACQLHSLEQDTVCGHLPHPSLYPRDRAFGNHWLGSWGDPRAGLDVLGAGSTSYPLLSLTGNEERFLWCPACLFVFLFNVILSNSSYIALNGRMLKKSERLWQPLRPNFR